MDLKDSFLTQSYKGCFIHSCHNRTTNRTEVRAQLPDGTVRNCTSVRTARAFIRANSN